MGDTGRCFHLSVEQKLFPLIEKIVSELGLNAKEIGVFFGHRLKFVEGHYKKGKEFTYDMIFDLFKFLKDQKLDCLLAYKLLPDLYEHPKMDFESILTSINFKRFDKKRNTFEDIIFK